jgi:UDP-N-acetylglucosamine--N-acetylmuramyl-(pentapeptide) pyrophosphoryl-undecaprenol N-acetylglucosamine transferase
MAHRFIVAGGGTAGHIEPALAVADALLELDSTAICEFLGTDGGLEKLLVPKRGYRLRTIPKVILPRKFTFSLLTFPLRLVAAIEKTFREIRGADVVIGFGGYVAAPAYVAAFLQRIPIVIHEANAKPGWANRLGRKFASITAVNFSDVQQSWPGSILTGMPIRKSLASVVTLQNRDNFRKLHAESWGFNPKLPIVAIFGGSQGSAHINQVVAEYVKTNHENQIIHAVGINNPLPPSQKNYLPVPYFHDMAAIYGSADLLVTRSGAVTCSELAALGKYSILIPLSHGNGEQVDNAISLVNKGAGVMVANADFSAQWLRENLPSAIKRAESFSLSPDLTNIYAANRIAQLVLGIVA